MNLIFKIKSYFLKHDFHLWKDFSVDRYPLHFHYLTNEALLDLGNFLKYHLNDTPDPFDTKFRLRQKNATVCDSLDDLLPLISKAVTFDYSQTLEQSKAHHWDFCYFINEHSASANTVCISNGLTSNEGLLKNCIYTIVSVRKSKGKYYFWNNFD
jgi:hypothetical protein